MADIDDISFEEAQLWNLPSVNEEQAKLDNETDAFNRPKNRWKFEAPENATPKALEKEEKIKPLTAKEIEEIRADAHQEGLASGHKEGFTIGYEEGVEYGKELGEKQGTQAGFATGKEESKKLIDAQMLELSALIENVTVPTQQINNEVQNELVILAMNLAKAIIKTDVQQNVDIVLQAINEGIKTLPINESKYQITLNAQDMAQVLEHYGQQHISDSGWQIIESSELERGGCHIHTQTNAVDVSIKRRSEQVFTQLLSAQGLIDDPRAV